MFPVGRQRRLVLALELLVGLVLIGLLALNALRRMDYLEADTMQHIRMTDASRTAYVAKNIAEGRGYTSNDLPAALIDFYDERGKLHDEHWVNADRFPFGAYLTAVLYKVTGSTSWKVGVLGYNVLFFIGLLLLIYFFAASVWADKYAGLFAVTIALLHPYTYFFLYWKDGDMLVLATATMALLVRYYAVEPGRVSRPLALGLGTILAWLFLARPNIGLPFLLFIGIGILRRLWQTRRELGLAGALRHHATRELLIPLTVIVWCTPFVIHSMVEWGQPLFSANNLYQLPLGTRYGMGTDTWWKYTEPGHLPTLGFLAHETGGQLVTKFTTSWAASIKHIIWAHGLELLLAGGWFAWLWSKRSSPPAEATRTEPMRVVAWAMLFAVATNVLLLPLYGYQSFSYRHYLSFGLPLLWVGGGRAISALVEWVRPTLRQIGDKARAHPGWVILAVTLGLIVWNAGSRSAFDQPRFFVKTLEFLGAHWLGVFLVMVAVLFRRWLVRPPWFPRVVVVAFSMVYACYRPSQPMKQTNFAFFAVDQRVWDSLRERKGLVSSFALQSEVAWNTDRKNIPVPEWPMHIYSFLYDHQLEVEDLYIESADAMLHNMFATSAPGFESYARMQKYRTFPGYELAFHNDAVRGYPRYRIKPILKASTVFKLVDRDAVQAMRRSPEKIELGDPRNVVYTAHGWEDYYEIDGRPVVAGTSLTRSRYADPSDAPYEDSSITFFIDDRVPRAVELEVFVPAPATYRFFWNLDLYAYDRARDRKAHELGTFTASSPGWQRIRLDIPPGIARKGLNKLGFRTDQFSPVVLCPQGIADEACIAAFRAEATALIHDQQGVPPRVVRAGVTATEFALVSLFAQSMQLHY